jgi:hypothetical protein
MLQQALRVAPVVILWSRSQRLSTSAQYPVPGTEQRTTSGMYKKAFRCSRWSAIAVVRELVADEIANMRQRVSERAAESPR